MPLSDPESCGSDLIDPAVKEAFDRQNETHEMRNMPSTHRDPELLAAKERLDLQRSLGQVPDEVPAYTNDPSLLSAFVDRAMDAYYRPADIGALKILPDTFPIEPPRLCHTIDEIHREQLRTATILFALSRAQKDGTHSYVDLARFIKCERRIRSNQLLREALIHDQNGELTHDHDIHPEEGIKGCDEDEATGC